MSLSNKIDHHKATIAMAVWPIWVICVIYHLSRHAGWIAFSHRQNDVLNDDIIVEKISKLCKNRTAIDGTNDAAQQWMLPSERKKKRKKKKIDTHTFTFVKVVKFSIEPFFSLCAQIFAGAQKKSTQIDNRCVN